jgi:transposase
MSWAKQSAKEGKIVEVGRSLCHLRAFQILPRRWVVERSFAWIGHNRRISLGTTRSCVQPARRSRVRCHESPHAEEIG